MRALATSTRSLLLSTVLLATSLVPTAHAQSITVDPTFGTDGFVLETFGADRASASSVDRLPDGRLVVLGSRGGGDLLAARYLPDGTLDPSFGGGDGWVSVTIPRPAPFGAGEAARSDAGSVSLRGGSGGGFYVHSQGLNTISRFTSDGSVDASFGDGGTVSISDPRLFRIHDVAEGIDGTVWVTGFGRNAANTTRRFLLVKLTPSGQLDTDYGEGGFALFGDENALAYDLLVQPDGRLILAGSLYASQNAGLAAARFTPDGALDPSFGDGGFFSVMDFAGIEAVALQPDGRLILAGTLQSGSTSDFYIARLTADGALDPSFDGDGSRVFNVGTSESFTGVTTLPDGRILASGYVQISQPDPAFALMNADGSPVTEFGFAGVSTFFFGPGPSWYSPVGDFVVLPNGQVVAVGIPQRQSTLPVHGVTRLDLGLSFSDGGDVLDPDYGEGGIVEADLGGLGGGDDTAEVTLDLPDGGLLTIGTSIGGTPPSRTYGIGCIRTLADGSLDPTFGIDGRVRVVLGGDSLAVNGAVRLSDGRVVVVGSEVVGGIRYILLIRFTGNGTLDAGFGTDGIVRYAYQNQGDSGEAVVVLPDGRLLVLALLGTGPDDRRATLIRFTDSGVLDATFGTDGIGVLTVLTDAKDLVLLPDGRVVASGTAPGGFALVRFTGNGTLDATFGSGGTRIVDLGDAEALHALVRLADGRLAAAGTVTRSGNADGFLTRFSADGALDTAFGTDGFAFVSFASGGFDFDTVRGLAALDDGRLLIVGYSNGRDVGDFFSFACLYTPAGVLDATFGNAGTLVLDLSPANDLAFGVRLLDDRNAVLVGSAGFAGAQDFVLAKFDPGESTVANEAAPSARDLALGVYPNPAQRVASLAFTLVAPGEVRAEVFDVLGRRVARLHEGALAAGRHALRWELPTVPSGVYVVRLTTPAGSATQRITVVH